MERTLAELWTTAAAERRGGAPFLVRRDEGWQDVPWEDAARSVDELAAGFFSLGIGAGDRVALLARTRLEWTLCDWALISLGSPVVPVYPTSSALECAYILGNSGAPFHWASRARARRRRDDRARRDAARARHERRRLVSAQ